ncbi:MAG: CBS domain-containing protein [Candidatus Krumholzibacteria bacterium]|nr:CBS domain-containing protein [Candidatus Krumholzibacteria bacterium]MDH4336009.1 CBS domain-containing protein [Candidatus Krumholzibacteria bacterium]MDH5268415.1 CBS domain-containing protein [Candidatus Krumholzibacteria bacterium]
MITVRDVLDSKGRQVWSVSPGDSVFQALELMSTRHAGALMVVENEKLVGVISERDYARKVVLAGKNSRQTAVGDIMTSKVYYVSPDHRIEECMALMTSKSVRHLPVLQDGRLDGVISIGDVVKAVISHQEFIIEQLEHFIAGR